LKNQKIIVQLMSELRSNLNRTYELYTESKSIAELMSENLDKIPINDELAVLFNHYMMLTDRWEELDYVIDGLGTNESFVLGVLKLQTAVNSLCHYYRTVYPQTVKNYQQVSQHLKKDEMEESPQEEETS